MKHARPFNPWIVAVVLLPMLAVGCYPDRSRPGVSARQGVYERYFPADQAAVYDAASDAMATLGYIVTDRQRFAGSTWQIQARDAGSNRITVAVEPGTLEAARVTVRIDPGRNDSMSQLILNAIDKELP